MSSWNGRKLPRTLISYNQVSNPATKVDWEFLSVDWFVWLCHVIMIVGSILLCYCCQNANVYIYIYIFCFHKNGLIWFAQAVVFVFQFCAPFRNILGNHGERYCKFCRYLFSGAMLVSGGVSEQNVKIWLWFKTKKHQLRFFLSWQKKRRPKRKARTCLCLMQYDGPPLRPVPSRIIHMCQGLNSHDFHIIGDKLINPIVGGVYIPIRRIPSLKVGGLPSPI